MTSFSHNHGGLLVLLPITTQNCLECENTQLKARLRYLELKVRVFASTLKYIASNSLQAVELWNEEEKG